MRQNAKEYVYPIFVHFSFASPQHNFHTGFRYSHPNHRKNHESQRFLQPAIYQPINRFRSIIVSYCSSKAYQSKKYKAYILKYKALISKYMACIFYNMPYVFFLHPTRRFSKPEKTLPHRIQKYQIIRYNRTYNESNPHHIDMLYFPRNLNIFVMQRFFCSMFGWT